jgi:hypothetical protein
MIHRIDKNLIGEKAYSSFTSKEMDYFNNSQFYIFEIRSKFNNLASRESSPKNMRGTIENINNINSNTNTTQFSYYMIRLNNENMERFEIACDTLKLYIPSTDRDNNAFKKIKTK